MPYLSRRILISLCPLVNLDLFKKGYYHIVCRLIDRKAENTHSRIECLEIKDMFGPDLNEFTYPGACIGGDQFITQTMMVEYSDQSFKLGEYFVFKSDCPIVSDHTDAYLPTHFTLQLDLMFSGGEELPKDPSLFSQASTRTISFTIDWRKGLHDYFPVLFDYFHMAGVGVTIHSSLVELNLNEFVIVGPTPQRSAKPLRTSTGGRKGFSFQSHTQPPKLPSLSSILFGVPSYTGASSETSNSTAVPMRVFPGNVTPPTSTAEHFPSKSRKAAYEVPVFPIERAQDAHQMLCDVLCSARDSLYIAYGIMSSERTDTDPVPDVGDITGANNIHEAEESCRNQIGVLNASLVSTWEWFCHSVIVHPKMISFLAKRCHSVCMSYSKETIIAHNHPFFKNVSGITNPISQAMVASRVRRGLIVPMVFYCKENVETGTNCSIIFVEPSPWRTLSEGRGVPATPETPGSTAHMSVPGTAPGLEDFTKHVKPYLVNSAPQTSRGRRRPAIHLVICVHGLQGNQYDLRLYGIYLRLALPHLKLEFLMASSNQTDTFCDFNLMTDRLLEEVLDFVRDMPTPPTKVSFIGHSLGSIVVRSLVTRPEFASLHPKLHLFFSICGPHLGTKYQNGIVSMGMWAVRKWYHSKSLLQLSLKDASDPADSFLFHLSEAPTFECFRHVVLLASPQDKYVPYHSARIATASQDGSLQSTLSLRMMQNILEPLRESRVNLVRISVDHNIPTSANSVIGRAAHIAMLDNELFIEKLVSLHLAQYFV